MSSSGQNGVIPPAWSGYCPLAVTMSYATSAAATRSPLVWMETPCGPKNTVSTHRPASNIASPSMKSSSVSARSSPVKCVVFPASERSGMSITPDICWP